MINDKRIGLFIFWILYFLSISGIFYSFSKTLANMLRLSEEITFLLFILNLCLGTIMIILLDKKY